jgi:hypothetical protein
VDEIDPMVRPLIRTIVAAVPIGGEFSFVNLKHRILGVAPLLEEKAATGMATSTGPIIRRIVEGNPGNELGIRIAGRIGNTEIPRKRDGGKVAYVRVR